jgi:ferredoxin
LRPVYFATPYPAFARLREQAPLYYNEQYDFYAVSRYEDVERGLLDRVFTPRKMNAPEPQIRAFRARALDHLVEGGRFNFIDDLGAEMPLRVIGMLLGIPDEDLKAVRSRVNEKMRTEPGTTLMRGAKDNDIPGIDADCGGAGICGTCHVYIAPAWRQRLAARTAIEKATIEFSSDVEPHSRLACQIKISEELDGLIVRMPESQ